MVWSLRNKAGRIVSRIRLDLNASRQAIRQEHRFAAGLRHVGSCSGVLPVTASPQTLDTRSQPTGLARTADPFHNPSYPQRVHFHERARLEEALRNL